MNEDLHLYDDLSESASQKGIKNKKQYASKTPDKYKANMALTSQQRINNQLEEIAAKLTDEKEIVKKIGLSYKDVLDEMYPLETELKRITERQKEIRKELATYKKRLHKVEVQLEPFFESFNTNSFGFQDGGFSIRRTIEEKVSKPSLTTILKLLKDDPRIYNELMQTVENHTKKKQKTTYAAINDNE